MVDVEADVLRRALAELRRLDESIGALEAASRARPDFQRARNDLAWIRERRAGAR